MATAAIIFACINMVLAAVEPLLAGMAAYGMLFGTCGLLLGAISIPKEWDDSGKMPPRTILGLALNGIALLIAVVIGLI
ncbi:MAG TPA: hypothetical protein PK926_14000 [Spirochaetota bacterium]|nr:hypothetical protein [Spirochaetota bacterium]HPI90545.1 hypothetical protein [Spirochaetota bacterium]HPR49130.1 hypothetical protein [Spirochaetota bacterium]